MIALSTYLSYKPALQRIEEEHLGILDEAPEPPVERPGTWVEDDPAPANNPQTCRRCHGVAVETTAHPEDPETSSKA